MYHLIKKNMFHTENDYNFTEINHFFFLLVYNIMHWKKKYLKIKKHLFDKY